MEFLEKIYNSDNLGDNDIAETTTRARALIINSNKEILMCYSNGRKHYEFPGGHLELGEDLITGLKREILEETGIELTNEIINSFFAIKYYCKNYHDSGKNRLVEIYYFLIYADVVYDTTKMILDENEKCENYECRYIKINDLRDTLLANKKTTKETDSSLDDMLLVWETFLARNK